MNLGGSHSKEKRECGSFSEQHVWVLLLNALPVLKMQAARSPAPLLPVHVPNYTEKLIVAVLEIFAENAPNLACPYKRA
jgi:hypothetical protein